MNTDHQGHVRSNVWPRGGSKEQFSVIFNAKTLWKDAFLHKSCLFENINGFFSETLILVGLKFNIIEIGIGHKKT